ncbi:DUF397 domain-containing protein [Actinomadura sp. 6K520]|uniref:DUF397 domain-containing protein n=1 Tax=Actinomadura sp. 6K520 TaxID=2530364 RepID=UPI00105125F5|nr:DUF397 domain-containing protein [Actinomadura sp. 6K520]TDE37327.1 DUF397 domain-containing protein [Actinomadura sp. 6K520]
MTQWKKSSRSADTGQTDCVEVARLTRKVAMRDSKAPQAGHLTLSPGCFSELVARIKRGELNP